MPVDPRYVNDKYLEQNRNYFRWRSGRGVSLGRWIALSRSSSATSTRQTRCLDIFDLVNAGVHRKLLALSQKTDNLAIN